MQTSLYFAQMNVAGQAASRLFGTDTVRAQLVDWTPDVTDRDLRNWEWYYLHGLSHAEEFVSEPLGNGFCWACDHSPDGRYIVNRKNAWGVQVRDARDGHVIAERFLHSARFVDWSPDGTMIAVGRFDDVCSVLDATTLETIRDFSIPSGGEGWCVRWHPNSNWLAEVCENGDPKAKREIRIHDVNSGELRWVLGREDLAPRFLSWSPDGNRLAASGMEKTAIWSLAARTPEVEEIFEGQGAIWSPDGSMLAVARQG
ncbi:MAG: hypothetical protein AAFN70_19710, partial [Planctomycetota bacterium]